MEDQESSLQKKSNIQIVEYELEVFQPLDVGDLEDATTEYEG